MVAIFFMTETKYACNLCQSGPNMIEIIQNSITLFSSKNHSHVTVERFLILQADIAII